MQKELSTLERIKRAAIEEFQEKGFQAASLRQIVKNAGVTTGAFYGYFSSKDALFAYIVEPHAKEIISRFMQAQTSFDALSREEKPQHVGLESGEYVKWFVDYVYSNKEEVSLLILKAKGTSYENFIHTMIEIEEEYTLLYIEELRKLKADVPVLDKGLCHILVTCMFDGIFEIVAHDFNYESAKKNIDILKEFYTAGWNKLISTK